MRKGELGESSASLVREEIVKRLIAGLGIGLGVVMMLGCSGPSEMISLSIPSMRDPAAAKTAKSAGPTVGVVRFEDKRANRSHLGTKTGRLGGIENFGVRGNDPGQAAATALTDYLRSKGWNASVMSENAASSADVMVSGEIQEMEVDAKNGFFSTDLWSKVKILVQGNNKNDGSKVRMTLTGSGTDSVFWFSPDDAQGLVNDVMTESFSKLVSSTKFENGALRLN